MTRSPVRVGLIGAGWYGTLAHAPAVVDDPAAQLAAVCDPDPARAREVADRFGVEAVFGAVEDMLGAGAVDAVVIAVPHRAHYDLARQALDHGVHVLVEKPMTIRADDAWDLVARSERVGCHLMVGHTYHCTSVAERLRQEVLGGALGEIVQISGTFCSPTHRLFRGEPAQADGRGGSYGDAGAMGGGQGYTQLTHLLALALWSTDLAPAEVFAFMNDHDVPVDLVDVVTTRFHGGALGSFASTGTLPAGHRPHQTLAYYGTRGMALHDIPHGRVSIRCAGTDERTMELAPGEPNYPLGGPVRALVELITGTRSDNPTPGPIGARSIDIVEAAYRSARTGRAFGVHDPGNTPDGSVQLAATIGESA